MAKLQPEPKAWALPATVLAVVLAGVAVWLHVAAVAVLYVGLLLAASLSRYPQLTGKGVGGQPEPIGPEVGRLAAHRRFTDLRSTMLTGFSAWLAWPASTSVLVALAAAFAAVTLPTDMAVLWRVVSVVSRDVLQEPAPFVAPAIDTSWMPWMNGALAYVTARSVSHVQRQHASEDEPAPQVTVVAAWKIMGGQVFWYATAGFVVVAAAAVAVVVPIVLSSSSLAVAIAPQWPLGVALGLAIIAAFVHAIAGPSARLDWQQRAEARQVWKGRFAQIPKAVATLRLVEHRRFGTEGTWWVDTFEVPATLGQARDITNRPDPYRLAVGTEYETVIDSSVSIVQGQQVPNARHPSRVDVITFPTGESVDVTDPAVDQALLRLWLQVAVVRGAYAGDALAPVFVDTIEPLHDPDDEGTRACWHVSLIHPDPGVAVSTYLQYSVSTGDVEGFVGAETVPFGDGFLVGAFGDDVAFTDESVRTMYDRHHRGLEIAELWRLTKVQFPAIPQFAVEKVAKVGQAEIQVLPHVVPKGQAVADYLAVPIEKIATSLPGAQRAALAYYPAEAAAAVRDGQPHGAAFTLLWTTSRTPLAPHTIAPVTLGGARPSRRGEGGPLRDDAEPMRLEDPNTNGTRDAMSIPIYEAFREAKLQLPYVVKVRPLSSPRSRKHLWELTLRMFGRAGLADLRSPRTFEALRNAFGSPYLRLAEGDDQTVRMIVGAEPEQVTFLSPATRGETIRADWEQAFVDAKLIDGGRVPAWVDMEPLERNPKVLSLTFRLPPGPLTIDKVRDKAASLRSNTRNEFIEVRPGSSPDEITVLACATSPVPHPAPWDWDTAMATDGIAFGVGVEGEPVVYRPVDDPHVLGLGATRSGKSQWMIGFVSQALIRGWDVWMIDAIKGLADFKSLEPYCHAFATTPQSAGAAAALLEEELERRVRLATEHGAASYRALPPEVRPRHVFIVIDEITSLALSAGDKPAQAQGDESPERLAQIAKGQADHAAVRKVFQVLGRILREGGSAGITALFAGQSLTKDVGEAIGVSLATFKNNTAKLALGAMSANAYLSAFGEVPDVAAALGESVPRGRGIYRQMTGRDQIVQTWFDGPEAEDNLASIFAHVQLVRSPLPAEERPDLDVLAQERTESVRAFGEVLEVATPREAVELEVDLEKALAAATELPAAIDFGDLDLGALLDDDQPAEVAASESADEPVEDDWLSEFALDDDSAGGASIERDAPRMDVPEAVENEAGAVPAMPAASGDVLARLFDDDDDDDGDDDGDEGDAESGPQQSPPSDAAALLFGERKPARPSRAQPKLAADPFDDLFGRR